MPTEAAKPTIRTPLLVDLALQGGGSHGAFTWGVLDRFLEEPWLEIDGISGTSAGAMNAAVMVHGHQKGGRARRRARRSRRFGEPGLGRRPRSARFRRGPLDGAARPLVARFLAHVCRHGSHVARHVSPYAINPMGKNPLREILAELIDFEARGAIAHSPVHHRLTNVRTGRGKVRSRTPAGARFGRPARLGLRLPTMFQAVEIDGEAYFGTAAYSGNPTLSTLVRECKSHDTILVPIQSG